MAKFYFTYGSEGHPFVGGWTEVEAQNRDEAVCAFRACHPDGKTDGFPNCCNIYSEEDFKRTSMYACGNMGHHCHETITLRRKLHSN